MTRDELAKYLDGREYINEIDTATEIRAKEAGLVVVFGASDDLMEFRGAIHDEIGCYDSCKAYLNNKGLIVNECDDEDCPHFDRLKKHAIVINGLWCDEPGICWTFKTDIPHSTFEIMEDGEKFCRGIVFDLKDV